MTTDPTFGWRSALKVAMALSLVLLSVAGSQAVAQAAAAPSAGRLQYFRSPTATYPFSDAVQAGDFLFVSGQVGQGQGNFEVAAKDALNRISKILVAHGSSMDNVAHCTVMLQDMRLWPAFNQIYAGYFKPERLPARSAFGVTALANNAPLEVECFAYNPPPP